jgi:RNA polymerase sigma-B factor
MSEPLQLIDQSKPLRLVDQLVRDNIRLVYKVANRYIPGSIEAKEDIEAAGMVGLVRAAQKYDPDTGYKFSSLAMIWIRGEILHYFRGKGGMPKVPRSWQDMYMKGYRLPDAEAAAINQISLEAWQEIKSGCSSWLCEWDEREHESTWEAEAEDELEEFEQAKAEVQGWLAQLEEGDRLLVEQVFFDGKCRDKLKTQRLRALLQTMAQSIPSARSSVISA